MAYPVPKRESNVPLGTHQSGEDYSEGDNALTDNDRRHGLACPRQPVRMSCKDSADQQSDRVTAVRNQWSSQ